MEKPYAERRVLFSCAGCQYKFLKPRGLKQCFGCDIGLLCFRCRYNDGNGESESYYCIDCYMARAEIKAYERKANEAQKRLYEWFIFNPNWETEQKTKYLSMPRNEDDWNMVGKAKFIEEKLAEIKKNDP